ARRHGRDAGPSRLRRPGPPAVPRLHRRGHVPPGPGDEPQLGSGTGGSAGGRPGHPAQTQGQEAVRRAAGPGLADHGAGQARAAARAGRAGLQPGPDRPAGIHAGRDGRSRRPRPDLPDLLPRGRRAGAVLRLADRPGPRARAIGRVGRRPARRAPAAHRPPRDPGRRAAREGHPPHRQRPALHRAGPHRPGPASGAGARRRAGRPGELRTAGHGLLAAPVRSSNHRQSCPGRGAARAEHQGGHTMIWVSWRQHRGQAEDCLAMPAALAAYAVIESTSMRTAFSHDGLAGSCLARSQGNACEAGVSAFMNEFGSAVNVAFWSVALIIPGLIGVLVGGSLLARELEYGTWRLAWSQTVPRSRWLAVKLALVTGGLIVLGAAMTAVITWYRVPMDRLTGHLIHNSYDYEGLVLTAYILCAFGFAVLAGLLIRRSIPAMVAAFIPWLAIR